jgi:hypothetical protein
MRKIYSFLFSFLCSTILLAQTPVPMATQPGLTYTENFADIANWTNGFTSGLGANRFSPVVVQTATGTIPDGIRITTGTTTFAATTNSGGVHRGTQNIILLSTGATDNTSSSAIDFLMDFTGVDAGTLSFDWASVNNSTGDRNGSLRIYYSTDNNSFTELTTAQVLNFTNNSPSSGSINSVTLPPAFNNSPTARLRFYYHNGTGGTTGSRPKISIDNLTVTADEGGGGNTVSVSPGAAAGEPATPGSFTINFSAPTSAPTDINFDFSGGSALFGSDYTVSYSIGSTSSVTSTGILTVPAGVSSVTLSIAPEDDISIEGTEMVSLQLSNPTGGYVVGTSTATINLTDNDVAPTVSVAAGVNGAEPSVNGTFLVTLSAPAPAGGITVNYGLSGTAIAGFDFSDGQAGSITINEGENSAIITLTTIDDPDTEAIETISITLNTVSAPFVIGSGNTSISLISDDFSPIILTTTYSQDFNSLAITGTANSLTIPGWLLNETGGGARDNELYASDNGGSNTGDTYSFGVASIDERALGAVQSGSLISSFGAGFTNNSGTTITRLGISFTGEQWRLGATGRNDRMEFQLSTNATNLISGDWTDIDQLDFVAPNATGTIGALIGNDPANRVSVSVDITGLSIAPGSTFFIRWNDANASGADDGLAIDDFTIEVNPLDLASPSIVSLSPANGTSDVSLNTSATITFNEPVQKVAGNIVLKKTNDNTIVQTIDINSASVIVSSTSVTFSLFGLSANTGYYIEIDNGAIEDISGNDFAGIAGNSAWAFTTGNDFYLANFNSCGASLADGFTQYNVSGAITWACTPFGRDPAAPAGTAPFPSGIQMNGFADGTNVTNVDWLISPSLDLTGTIYPLLSFWSRTAFNGLPIQLKVSTDYIGGDPSQATWTDLNGKFPGQTSNIWTLSSGINLSAFKQSNVHFAFVYTSSDDDGARWTVDDVSVINSTTPPPPSLTVGVTDIQFNYVASGSTTDKTFVFTGNDLIADVSLTATGNFLLSKDGSSYSPSIIYTVAEANNIPRTVFVRFAPNQSNQNFTGTATVSTSSLSFLINLKGTSIDPATTLEVVNWNIEWFGSTLEGPTNEAQQEQNVKTILQNTGADVYGLVEVVDETKLASVVSQLGGYSYVISNYGSHTNTAANPPSALAQAQKLAFIYKTSLFSNVTATPLLSVGINTAADLTNPNYNYWASGRFPFMLSADVTLNCVTRHMKFVVVHAKANTSPTNISYERRKNGADALYAELNALYPNDQIIILGDFNDDLDQSITAGFTTTSWNIFTEDTVNYSPLTLPLSLAGKKSTVSYNDVIDHVVVSNEVKPYYMSGTATILSDVTTQVSNYGSSTSDHFPVFSRYTFANSTAPLIVSCPTTQSLCFISTNTYTIPVFEAADDCDAVTYSYTITGATQRNGTGNNASGVFSLGTSIVNWTAQDSWGNTTTCQTTVIVKENPSAIIPDAFALSSGTVSNTVYIGYAPASSITLNVTATGGAAPYTYSWSNGSVAQSITVAPVVPTTYQVTITDAGGCTSTASKSISIKDIRGKGGRVIICHKPQAQANTIEVVTGMVASHLSHGDILGTCSVNQNPIFVVTVSPNPSRNYFSANARGGNPSQTIGMRVLDVFGRTIESRNNLQPNQLVNFGNNYQRGLYFAEFWRGTDREIISLLKW